MPTIQDITRILLAAAATPEREDGGGVFVFNRSNTLISKTWDGKQWGQDEALIANDASPTTPAVYYSKSDGSEIVFYISSSSVIKCRKAVDGEWSDDTTFSAIAVHAQSKLHGSVSDSGDVALFFQNPSGQLVLSASSKSWAQTVLPVSMQVGSPVTVSQNVFYVGAEDGYIHSLVDANGTWTDSVLAKVTIPEKLQHVEVIQTDANSLDAFILTEKHTVFQLVTAPGQEEKRLLGKVDKDGQFVPGESAECGGWYPRCCRCGCCPCRCGCRW